MKLLLLLNIFFGLCACSRFDRADPILWRETDYYVDQGIQHWRVSIVLDDPCGLIGASGIGKGLNIMQKSTIYQCRSEYARLMATDNKTDCWHKHNGCGERYRKKRFVFGFVCGIFISNFIRTITERIWPDPVNIDIYNHFGSINKNLILLRHENDIQSEILKAVTSAIQTLQRKTRLMEEEAPELTAAQIYFSRKMNDKIDLIKTVQRSFIHGKIDFTALRQLTNSSWPSDVDEETATPYSYYREAKNVFTFEFTGHRKNTDMKVYRIEAFNYYKDIDSQSPKLATYDGPKHVVVNATNMCVRGVRVSKLTKGITKDYSCQQQDYREPSLSRWRYGEETVPKKTKTDIRMSEKGPVVYCYGDSITVNGKTSRCPPWPFQRKIDDVFNTTTYSYRGESERYEFEESYLFMPLPDSHGDHSVMDDETVDIGRMVELEKELEGFRRMENKTWINTPVFKATSEGVLGTGGALLFIIAAVVVVLWWKSYERKPNPSWR